MTEIATHIDDVQWGEPREGKSGRLRWKEVFNESLGDSKEFVFGYAELDAGDAVPLHTHDQAEAIFITAGSAKVRLGKRVIDLASSSAAYFPAGAPHGIEALGHEPLCYISTYATEKLGQNIEIKKASEEAASRVDILNDVENQWAVLEEYEPWVPIEPSKGRKGMMVRRLFGFDRGNWPELMGGTCLLQAGAHYTLHYHDQAEIYYGLSGRGIVYVGDEKVDVYPGVAIYAGSRVVHGADALGAEPFRMYWLYGTESTGDVLNWTPVEDIYTEVRGS